MTDDTNADQPAADPVDAPDPDSREFQEEQNPVERLSPDTTADAPAVEPELIPTDPGQVEDTR